MEFIEVSGRHFNDEVVEADGRQFVDCTFNNAPLEFGGKSPFILSNCKGTLTIEFVDAASNTLDQLKTLYRFGYADFVEQIFAAIRNPLGEAIN